VAPPKVRRGVEESSDRVRGGEMVTAGMRLVLVEGVEATGWWWWRICTEGWEGVDILVLAPTMVC
jgi:hypothetical protein